MKPDVSGGFLFHLFSKLFSNFNHKPIISRISSKQVLEVLFLNLIDKLAKMIFVDS